LPERPPSEPSPSALGLALTYLRSAAAWSKNRLARALGLTDASLISHYERGKPLTREQLESLVEPLGQPSEAVDVLLFAHDLIFPEPLDEPASPVALSPEERRVIDRAAMAAGWMAGHVTAGEVRGELIRRRKQEKVEAAKQEAAELYQGLMVATREDRVALVEAFPEYWNWALAVRVCEQSVKRAAHRAEEALELAHLALSIAERVPGEQSWRRRLMGYCWAHVANALRVANNFAGADEAFVRAWELWRAGAGSDPELLAEWQLFSLEASLRRAQLQFSAALKLLDRALETHRDGAMRARILLQKGNVFEQMGDSEKALAALREAALFVEESGDPRLDFGLRFDTANNLALLSRYAEAAELTPRVRELALQQANDLDLIRLVWLESRVAAGEGRPEEAVAGLEQVRGYFTAREHPYDAALSSLDLAVLWLKSGRAVEVKELAVAMGWIFKAERIDREALEALKLFCDAARQERASVELTRQVATEIEKARRSAPPTSKRRDRG
jgi:tetratricopeptide (TPR) repeat protein